jgi:hypothetical protein
MEIIVHFSIQNGILKIQKYYNTWSFFGHPKELTPTTTYQIVSSIVWNGGSCDTSKHNKWTVFTKYDLITINKKPFGIRQLWCIAIRPPNLIKLSAQVFSILEFMNVIK